MSVKQVVMKLDVILDKVVSLCVCKKIISESETEWCRYTIETRILTWAGFCLLIAVGCIVAPFLHVFCFTLTFRFLRERTNGYHAKSRLKCVILSLLVEILCMLLLRWVNSTTLCTTTFISGVIIAVLAPVNNAEINFSAAEFAAVKRRVYVRLALVLAVLLLVWHINLAVAASLSLGTAVDAAMIVAAKLESYCNRRQ